MLAIVDLTGLTQVQHAARPALGAALEQANRGGLRSCCCLVATHLQAARGLRHTARTEFEPTPAVLAVVFLIVLITVRASWLGPSLDVLVV